MKFFVICLLEVPLGLTIAALLLFAQILAVMPLGPVTLGPSARSSNTIRALFRCDWCGEISRPSDHGRLIKHITDQTK